LPIGENQWRPDPRQGTVRAPSLAAVLTVPPGGGGRWLLTANFGWARAPGLVKVLLIRVSDRNTGLCWWSGKPRYDEAHTTPTNITFGKCYPCHECHVTSLSWPNRRCCPIAGLIIWNCRLRVFLIRSCLPCYPVRSMAWPPDGLFPGSDMEKRCPGADNPDLRQVNGSVKVVSAADMSLG